MKKFLCFVIYAIPLFFHMAPVEALISHKYTIDSEWREDSLPPFNELMVSWNAVRPLEGKFLFYISVKTDDWSPWLLYATWGSDGQASYQTANPDAPIKVFQDALEVAEPKKATGFQIRVVSEGSASLTHIRGLHVYTNGDTAQASEQTSYLSLIHLPVQGLSQIAINHARCRDLCSPTSTTAVVRYLSGNLNIDPAEFAAKAWDGGFDIFGNWVFNVAQASTELGPAWNCWVERLHNFDDIYNRLYQGTPVVVSVRGPLQGSAAAYAKGHLMAVIGYDPVLHKVICMDPAFPSDDQTQVFYDFSDFVQAWSRRGKIAYVFSKK